MAAPRTAVAKAQSTEVGQVIDYGDYGSAGFENTSQDDFSVPFLDILQGQSPEVESLDAAKPGMFHNTVTDELFDGKTGVSVVVVATAHEFVEWKPRNQGGGIVGRHKVDSEEVFDAKRNAERFNELTHNGNDLVETFYAYLILNLESGPVPAVLSCSSTRIKPYKAMMTKANMIMIPHPSGQGKVKPPLFAHKFLLTTAKRKNNDGEWHTFEVAFDSPDKSAAGARLAPTDDLFQAAVSFYEVIKAGAFTTSDAGEAKARETSKADGDVPF